NRMIGSATATGALGGVVSRTVTVKPPVATLPAASCAVQVTAVVPSGDRVPGGGAQLAAPAPAASSVAVPVYGAAVPPRPPSSTVMLARPEITGAVPSVTENAADVLLGA